MRRASMSRRADPPHIRIARPDEHAPLEALMRRASLALPHYREDLERHPDAIALPPAQLENGDVLVAEDGDGIAGFAAVVGGELDGLFVEPAKWRRGIGSALVVAAAHVARQRGTSLTVVAGPEGREFYESCGFSVEGSERTRFGPALRMSR